MLPSDAGPMGMLLVPFQEGKGKWPNGERVPLAELTAGLGI